MCHDRVLSAVILMRRNMFLLIDYRHVAILVSRLSLSDFGEVPANLVVERPSSSSTTSTNHDQRGLSSPPPSQTAEYKAALELELWKDAQEKLFEKQVK